MSTISAGTTTTTAFKVTSDTTGSLLLKTGASGATAIDIDAAQVVSIGNIAVTGGTINNTIIGGTTAVAGSFTTLTAASTVTLNGGTANGVAYLNGSKNLTTGSALTFDGTDLATTGGVRLNNGQYYYGKNAAGSAVRLLGVNAGNVNYVGAIDSGPTEVNYGAASTVTAQYWNISGSERMRLNSTGLGIGTASPVYKLDVQGGRTLATANSETYSIGVRNRASLAPNGNYWIGATNAVSPDMVFSNNAGTENLRLTDGGNVGIGTASPAVKLEVSGSVTTTADVSGLLTLGRFSAGYPWSLIRPSSGSSGFEFRSFAGTAWLNIDTSGNLGIGTTSPAFKLSVSGVATTYAASGSLALYDTVSGVAESRNWLIGNVAAGNYGELNFAVSSAAGGAPTNSKMTLDRSGNLGLGVTPSAWASSYKSFQLGSTASLVGATNFTFLNTNVYFDSSDTPRYLTTAAATRYQQDGGAHKWFNAASGTAGNTISFTQAMTLDASGNLMVGTTSANAKVKIALTGSSTTPIVNVASFGSGGVVSLGGIANNSEQVYLGTGDTSGGGIAAGIGFMREASGWNSALSFYTNNVTSGANGVSAITERARITSGGNFQLNNGTLIVSAGSGDSYSARLSCAYNFPTVDTYLDSYAGASYSGQIMFRTNSGGGAMTERARIDSNGRVIINGTTQLYTSTLTLYRTGNSYNLTSTVTGTGNEGHVVFENGNGAVGTIFTNGTATAYNTSSDYRLKNTIAPMTGALAKVALLKPCTYKWNADGSDGQGFIAHELAEVVPQCVTGEKDAVDAEGKPQYQGVDTSFLVATLTAAIQELTARVASLESK